MPHLMGCVEGGNRAYQWVIVKRKHKLEHMVAAYFLELWRRALEQQTVTITLCNMTRT